TLTNIGELRLVDAAQRFHPKVFLFRGPGRLVAWIGSANFTSGGFGMNEEAMFETTNAQSVAAWFDQLWNRCGPIGVDDIDEYAASRRRIPPLQSKPPPLPAAAAAISNPAEILHEVDDWRDFIDALHQCDRWWSTRSGRWSVLGELHSWSQTIQELHDLVINRDFRSLDDHDRRRLLGRAPDEVWWALLGRMRPRAIQTVFRDHVTSIQDVLRRVAVEPESAFPNAAVRAYAQLISLDGVGRGIATRLLTLARPDRFVSLNGASKASLAASFDVAPNTLDQPRSYGRLLERVYDRAWYSDPHPTNAREENIRWMRAALLDSFMYEP
ncbi:MAG: phospholipase D family protein, partial [Gammaproteobacteria bacterium]|nr:phospholipase D family protein [Gammaproteobacteria bacterium]